MDFLRESGICSMDAFFYLSRLRGLSNLSKEDIKKAIQSACDFFGIPEPLVAYDISNSRFAGTMFVNLDPTTFGDDILCYNMKELASLGIGSKDAFSLIMTHECAHRFLQNVSFEGPYSGSWQHELAADFLMGCRAGLQGMSQIQRVMDGLSKTGGSKTHPKGFLRSDFIRHGLAVTQRIALPISLKALLMEYLKHYDEMWPYIKKDEKEIYNFFERRNR